MEIKTEDYEKLGAFYLGRTYDMKSKSLEDELVLYKSKDLVTHGVVLGMTGSGKTGLCLALLEEAAMDNIPAIVIDPKGDIANILLTFPELRGEDFRPWINEEDAQRKGVSPDEFASEQAETWRKGLSEWGQSPDRIRQFREKVDITIYTPGSNAGLPVSILSSLGVPEFEILDDAELLAERIESTVSSLLSLMGYDADPIQDPRHILLSNIFSYCWRGNVSVTLESLIRYIQSPPFEKVGVMPVDQVCTPKDRAELAMKMNNLLASPGFAVWMQGEGLDIKRALHTKEGKPRITIYSIAHLGDTERMFFVSLLLNQTLGWMRSQSGTTSLRALLYMDEIYGYLPPTANPPSKKPMLTMLKQARAFGLGILLATQNPVDLDYKALSNMGTWWLGRLQTERDKMRVLDGLEGAAAGHDKKFDRAQMEQLLAGLGNRIFLMNNVNLDAPVVFGVRWCMSYLRGPLARTQIKQLMDPRRPADQGNAVAEAMASMPVATASNKPVTPRGTDEFFLPSEAGISGKDVKYSPALIRIGEVRYSDNKKGIDGIRTVVRINRINPTTGRANWDRTDELPDDLTLDQVARQALEGAEFANLPMEFTESKNYTKWKAEFADDLYANDSLTVFYSPGTKQYSNFSESEGDFRVRLQHAAHEVRDKAVEELKAKYQKKMDDLERKVTKAMDVLAEQKSQASQAKLNTVISIGSSILGAILGKGSISSSRGALGGASRTWKEGRDVSRAEEEVARWEDELKSLEDECEKEVEKLKSSIDPSTEKLETSRLTPLKKNVSAKSVGILWIP